jgi:hypothetical protein
MGYTSRYDAREWVPYAVREITGPDQDKAKAVAEFRDRIGANEGANAWNFQVGKPYALVRTGYVDERTHYRVGKAEDGTPQNVLLRRMAEDVKSYVASVLDAEGRSNFCSLKVSNGSQRTGARQPQEVTEPRPLSRCLEPSESQ